MPRTPHIERHFTASDRVRDVVIGMSDGLTVPFALAAGLSGAVGSSGVVVVAGLAEIAAGAIAMGLGGYLAARSDAEHYTIERARELAETGAKPAAEAAEVTHILRSFGLTAEDSEPIVAALRKRPEAWVDFMMRFELGLEKPDPRRALSSALTIGGVRRRRLHPARPLHGARERPRGIDGVGGRHGRGARALRVGQSTLYGSGTAAQCLPHDADRRGRRGRGLRDRAGDHVACMLPAARAGGGPRPVTSRISRSSISSAVASL